MGKKKSFFPNNNPTKKLALELASNSIDELEGRVNLNGGYFPVCK